MCRLLKISGIIQASKLNFQLQEKETKQRVPVMSLQCARSELGQSSEQESCLCGKFLSSATTGVT